MCINGRIRRSAPERYAYFEGNKIQYYTIWRILCLRQIADNIYDNIPTDTIELHTQYRFAECKCGIDCNGIVLQIKIPISIVDALQKLFNNRLSPLIFERDSNDIWVNATYADNFTYKLVNVHTNRPIDRQDMSGIVSHFPCKLRLYYCSQFEDDQSNKYYRIEIISSFPVFE